MPLNRRIVFKTSEIVSQEPLLRDEDFAVPGLRLYPIDTEAHARLALKMSANDVSRIGVRAVKDMVQEAVSRRWPQLVTRVASSTDPLLQRYNNLPLDFLADAIPQITMEEFYELAALGSRSGNPVKCKGCGAIANFDADLSRRTIRCLKCSRQTSIEQFKAEQNEPNPDGTWW